MKLKGFWLGLIFGILGLLGLLGCYDDCDKSEFFGGWIIGIAIGAMLAIILYIVAYCSAINQIRDIYGYLIGSIKYV